MLDRSDCWQRAYVIPKGGIGRLVPCAHARIDDVEDRLGVGPSCRYRRPVRSSPSVAVKRFCSAIDRAAWLLQSKLNPGPPA